MNRLLRRTGLVIAVPAGALALAGGAIAFAQQGDGGSPSPENTPAQKDHHDGCDRDKSGGDVSNVV